MLPYFVCLMPTYGRPKMVENTIACFLAQDYPAERRHLLILDDAGQIPPQKGDGWEVFSTAERFPSLPAKYAELLRLPRQLTRPIGSYADTADVQGDIVDSWNHRAEVPLVPDAYAVWDDDDIYLPWHLAAHAEILQEHGWSHPSRVWSTYTGRPELENAAGRFHGSLAVRRELMKQIGGWPETPRADFDQQMLWRLADAEPAGDPTTVAVPSYVFRWGSTRHPHCQGFMRSPDNTTWYGDYAGAHKFEPHARLEPALDPDTRNTIAAIDAVRRRQYATDDVVQTLLDTFGTM